MKNPGKSSGLSSSRRSCSLVAQLCRGWLEAAVKYVLDSDRGDKPRKLDAAQSRVSLGGLPCFGLGVVARQNLRGIGMLAVVEGNCTSTFLRGSLPLLLSLIHI